MKMRHLYVMVIIALLCGSSLAVDVLMPGYNVEIYAAYTDSGIGRLSGGGMAFDPSGNLYLCHRGADLIYKVDAAKNASRFVQGLDSPEHIIWAGGSAYGDYLYVAEEYDDTIVRIDLSGGTQNFSSINGLPVGLAVDPTGNYGSKMYTAVRDNDRIVAIETDGSSSTFSSFPGAISNGYLSIDFDTHGKYGSRMFVSLLGSSSPVSGLFVADFAGNVQKFSPDFTMAGTVKFDPSGLFANDMFVTASLNPDFSGRKVFRVNPDGSNVPFAVETFGQIDAYVFGNDGALYVAEYDYSSSTTTISRITPVPEPLTVGLLGLGALLIRKKH